jgi:pimeloyl-ACP methyl ester carboxylesterase
MTATKNLGILLLPGLDGTGELLNDLRHRLSVHRQVTIIDYPMNRPLDYDQLTTFVGERVPSERFIILGESFSGPIAIQIAVQEKVRVAGLILASTFAKHPLPAIFAVLAKVFDHTWMPHSIVEGALLGTAGTPGLFIIPPREDWAACVASHAAM